jgi:hypothetical protein
MNETTITCALSPKARIMNWIKKLFRKRAEEHKTRPRRLTRMFEM